MTATARRGWAAQLSEQRDPPSAWPPPGRLRVDWQLATLVKVIPETPDTVTLRLRRASNEAFLPGQHFHVEIPAGEAYPAVETYTVASSPWPQPGVIDLTVKEIPGGRVSPILVRKIPVGAVMGIEGPFGYFTWTQGDGGPLALVGAGSGIVPLMAFIRYASAKELCVPIRLLCSSKDRLHGVYFDQLSRLAERHSWLEVVHTFTADPADPAARYHRRVDQEMLNAVFADIAEFCLAYVCGPFAMVTTTEKALQHIGVGAGRLFSENWE
ncbi:MAG: FAD-binding oxidoreductase [Acidimicrobiales bacterium]